MTTVDRNKKVLIVCLIVIAIVWAIVINSGIAYSEEQMNVSKNLYVLLIPGDRVGIGIDGQVEEWYFFNESGERNIYVSWNQTVYNDTCDYDYENISAEELADELADALNHNQITAIYGNNQNITEIIASYFRNYSYSIEENTVRRIRDSVTTTCDLVTLQTNIISEINGTIMPEVSDYEELEENYDSCKTDRQQLRNDVDIEREKKENAEKDNTFKNWIILVLICMFFFIAYIHYGGSVKNIFGMIGLGSGGDRKGVHAQEQVGNIPQMDSDFTIVPPSQEKDNEFGIKKVYWK